jgi:hypothetical protein
LLGQAGDFHRDDSIEEDLFQKGNFFRRIPISHGLKIVTPQKNEIGLGRNSSDPGEIFFRMWFS